MRLPFLQVHQDDLARGRVLARILRVPEAHATGIVVLLDAWALGETEGGVILDPDPAGAVALAVGWEGDAGALLAGLVRVRLIDEQDGNFRVSGTVRYDAALSSPGRRSEAARVAATERWHGKNDANRMGSASDRNAPSMRTDAKTQTQTQKEEDPPPPSSAARREDLGLEAVAPKPAKKAKEATKPKPEKPTDPRHAPLTKELCEVHGWPHHGGRTAKAISSLLDLAAQGGQEGDAGHHEVVRRAMLARAHVGYPAVRELHEIVTHWGHFAEPQRRSTGPHGGLEAVPPDTCAGCGARGQGGSVGEPDVWLGYECGCLPAFTEAQSKGLHFTNAAEWAAQRRAA